MVSNVTGMTRRCHHDLGCIFREWNDSAAGCAGASNGGWLCGDVAAGLTGGPRLCGDDWVFQRGNTAVHDSRLMKDFFQENNVALLDHPACSCDLKIPLRTLGDGWHGKFKTWMPFVKPSLPHGTTFPPASWKHLHQACPFTTLSVSNVNLRRKKADLMCVPSHGSQYHCLCEILISIFANKDADQTSTGGFAP